jgi:hypothetical protein
MNNSVSSAKLLAFMVTLAGALFNSGFAYMRYTEHNQGFFVFHLCLAIFSGILALINFCGWIGASYDEEVERTYRRIYNAAYRK